MNRYLAPAPAQYDLGQQHQIAAARFGSIIDLNTVDNSDGTRSLAVYLNQPATATTVTSWQSDVAASVYTPDPTVANQQTVAAALAQALTDLQAILDAADPPAGTLTTAQLSNVIRQLATAVKTLALIEKRAIRYVTGDFTGAN